MPFLLFLLLLPLLFSRGLRDSISHCQSVGPSVYLSVGLSVPRLLFWRFASGFYITVPAQSHVTDAAVYTAILTAPAHHITAPAQPLQLMVSCIRPFSSPLSRPFSSFWAAAPIGDEVL